MSNGLDVELPRFAALDHLPTGYELTRRLAIESRQTFFRLNFLSLIPFVVGALIFYGEDRLLEGLHVPALFDMPLNDSNRLTLTVIAAILTLAMLSIHEICHGLAFQAFGARPKYGINLRKGVAYASAKDYYLTRDAYLVVALAPLVAISLAVAVGMAVTGGGLRFILALMGAANAGASIGDLWFTWECVRQPPDLLVRDYGDGAELYTRGR